MKKKTLLIIATIALMIYVPSVSAETIEVNDDTSLVNAFENAKTNDTIKLTASITHDGTYLMVDEGRTLTLDLNGFDLTTTSTTASNRSVTVENGNLTVTGKGTITREGHNALAVWGSADKDAKDYSVLTVGKDVTLVGAYGVGILNPLASKDAYGVKVVFAGKAIATASGITVSGNIKHENGPVVTIKDGAELTGGTEAAIYVAGNSTWTIGNAKVSGNLPLGIKSGNVTINGGTYQATGEYATPTENNSGINPTGSTIQIESNANYYGHINLTINGGTFTSENNHILEEYTIDSSPLKVEKIQINGGKFISDNLPIELSEKYQDTNPKIISGGTFNNDVSEYVVAGTKTYVSYNEGVSYLVVEKMENTQEGAYTITGKVSGAENNTTIQLRQGAKVLQTTNLDEDGNYSFTKVAKGTYTIAIIINNMTTSRYIKVEKNTTENITINDVYAKIFYIENNLPDIAVQGLDEIIQRGFVTMLVSESNNEEAKEAVKTEVKAENYDFIDLSINGEETTELDNPLMLALSYDLEGKTNIAIARYHDETVDKFKKLTAMPESKEDYEDGTYYVDEEEGIIYVFTSKFSTYAVTYDNAVENESTITNPQTSDNILRFVGMMFVAITLSGVGTYYYKKRKQTN